MNNFDFYNPVKHSIWQTNNCKTCTVNPDKRKSNATVWRW